MPNEGGGEKKEVGRAIKHEREMKNEEPANRASMHDAVTRKKTELRFRNSAYINRAFLPIFQFSKHCLDYLNMCDASHIFGLSFSNFASGTCKIGVLSFSASATCQNSSSCICASDTCTNGKSGYSWTQINLSFFQHPQKNMYF